MAVARCFAYVSALHAAHLAGTTRILAHDVMALPRIRACSLPLQRSGGCSYQPYRPSATATVHGALLSGLREAARIAGDMNAVTAADTPMGGDLTLLLPPLETSVAATTGASEMVADVVGTTVAASPMEVDEGPDREHAWGWMRAQELQQHVVAEQGMIAGEVELIGVGEDGGGGDGAL